MNIQWLSILFILLILIVFEMIIYILYLIIKALKVYIDRNSNTSSEELPKVRKRKPVKGIIIVAVCNVLFIAAIIATVYIQRNSDIYYTENVISFQSESDVEKCTLLLEENGVEYKVLDGKRVKMKNRNDYLEAEEIIKDNSISFSTVTIQQ